jgi:cytochrome c1
MSKILPALVVVIGLGLVGATTPSRAGGWAVLTLDDWPADVVANRPFTISFSLRQHGQHLMNGQIGNVEFDDEQKSNAAPLQFDVLPAAAQGHYTATITLPSAGAWQWRIVVFGKHTMPLLTVHAMPAPPDQASEMQPVTLGRTLFVAKGCSRCHVHSAVPGSRSIGVIGAGAAIAQTPPPLPNRPLTAEYLRQWLTDPKAVKPTTLMPNLDLKQSEVDALTAFLLNAEQE